MSDYNKAIEINPNYAEAYNNRGNIYAQQEEFTKAISNFSKAVKLKPSYAAAYKNHNDFFS